MLFRSLVPRQPELASCWENLSKLRWRHVFPTKAPELAECEVLLRFLCNGRIRALGRSPNIMLVMKNETSLFHVSRPDQNTINNGSIRGMNYICVSAARDPVSIASRTEAGNMVNTTVRGRTMAGQFSVLAPDHDNLDCTCSHNAERNNMYATAFCDICIDRGHKPRRPKTDGFQAPAEAVKTDTMLNTSLVFEEIGRAHV